MDVGCPKCSTEYELDDSRVPDDGVTVKCTSCQHVFRVKRKSLVVTLPVRPEEAKAAAELPPPPPAREWKVRQPNAPLLACRELTALQKWIIEGRVTRDAEISLTGETWKRLGEIPELASFFQVVDDAVKARAYEAAGTPLPSELPPPPPPISAPPPEPGITDTWKAPSFSARVPGGSSLPPPPATLRTETVTEPAGRAAVPPSARETLRDPAFAVPVPARSKPPPQRYEPSDSQLARAAKGSSGSGWWLVLVIGGLGVGGAAGYYFGVYQPEQLRLAAESAAARATPPVPVVVPDVVRDAGVEPELDAGMPDAGVEAVDAGEPDAGLPDAGPPDAGPKRLSFDGMLVQAERYRDRDRAEAALDLYGRAHELKPERVEPLTGRGLTLLDMGNAIAAQAAFEQALALNERYSPAIMGMAEALRVQGKNAKAIEFYQRYLDVSPEGSEAAVARNNIERLKK